MTGISLVIVAVTFVYTILNIAISNFSSAAVIFAVCSIIVSNLVTYKNRITSYSSTGVIFMLSIGLLLSFLQVFAPATFFANVIWIPAFGILGVFLLGERIGFMVGIINSSVLALGFLIPKITPITADPFSQTQIISFNIVSIFLCFSCFYLITRLFLRQKNNALKEVSHQKDELFKVNEQNRSLAAMLSHDLANPLFVMKILNYKLKSKQTIQDLDKVIEISEQLDEVGSNMEAIIDNARTLISVADGKKELTLEQCLLDKVLRESLIIFQFKAKNKGILIETNIHEKDCSVLAEKTSLKNSVIGNLVSNAIKFTPSGRKIVIDVFKHEESLRMQVKDQGIGIPKTVKDNLFRHDVKTTRDGTQGEKGTGFGMPIMKHYLDIYGAGLSIDSVTEDQDPENSGTTFTVDFIYLD